MGNNGSKSILSLHTGIANAVVFDSESDISCHFLSMIDKIQADKNNHFVLTRAVRLLGELKPGHCTCGIMSEISIIRL